MRTLSDELKAAQQASSGIPYVYVKVGDTDYTSRVKAIRQTEKPFGGTAYVILSNHDKSISGDMRGDMVRVGWGYKIGESQEYSFAPPMWVLRQRGVSTFGQLTTELELIDIWGKLSLVRVIGGGGVMLKGDITGTFMSGYKVTQWSTGARGTVLRAGDGYLALVKTDQTAGEFTIGGVVTADLNSDIKMTISDVSDYAGGAAPYWAGSRTYLEIIQDLTDGIVDVVLDSSDGRIDVDKPYFETENNTPVSNIIQELISRTKCGIRAQDDSGVCKLHIFDATSDPGTPHYEYNTDHAFLVDVKDISCILPNQVIVAWSDFGLADVDAYYGSAKDDDAIARFGLEISQLLTIEVVSNDEADDIAEAKLNRILKEATRGNVTAPMNCGQELFDYIKVTDTRAGVENYGWVGNIDRYWQPELMAHEYGEDHPYRIEIGLGDLSSAAISTLPPYPLPPVPTPTPTPSPSDPILVPFHYPVSIQGYIHDIDFEALDHHRVSWSSGTIKFYDGTSHAIFGSFIDLTHDDVVYLYFKLTSIWLQSTTDYLSKCDLDTGLVCIVQRGRADGGEGVPEIKATVIPSSGKMPLICADHIHLSGIALDDISEGATYKRVIATDISAGHVKLTVQQDMDAQGLEIVSTQGYPRIRINTNKFGMETAEDIYSFYVDVATGKAYCAAGDVVLDSDGVTITGTKLRFKYDDTIVGYLYSPSGLAVQLVSTVNGGSANLWWKASDGGYRALLCVEDDVYPGVPGVINLGKESVRWRKLWGTSVDVTGDVKCDDVRCYDDIYLWESGIGLGNIMFDHLAGAHGYIGDTVHYPKYIYAKHLRYKVDSTSWQGHDDVAILRGILEKAGEGRIQAEHFPDELTTLDAGELDTARLHCEKAINELRQSGNKLSSRDRRAKIAEKKRAIKHIGSNKLVDVASWNSLLMGAIVQQDDRIKQLEARLASIEGGG